MSDIQTQTINEISSAIQTADKQISDGQIHVHVSKRKEKIEPINTFALCFTASLAEIMDKYNLSRPAIRLLLELLNTSRSGNLISIHQKGLATRLKVSKSSISRSMKELHTTCILIETEMGLFLNPQLITKEAFATTAKKYKGEIQQAIAMMESKGMSANWHLPK